MDRDVRRDTRAGELVEAGALEEGGEVNVGARKTNSGGMFSPSVRVSLAIFLRFSLSLRPMLLDSLEGSKGEGGTTSTFMFMLNVEETGESGWGGELLCMSGFIRLPSGCAGTARRRSSSGCEGCPPATPLPFSLFEEDPERLCFDPSEMMVIGTKAPS
jgi:hypothetical protein